MVLIKLLHNFSFITVLSYLERSFTLAKTDFKLRNEGSFLGVFWYLLDPLLTFIILYFVFHDRVGREIDLYALQLLLGIIIFNYFQKSTVEAATAIIDNGNLIRAFPLMPSTFVTSVVLKHLFSHGIEVFLFAGFLVYHQLSLVYLIFYLFIAVMLVMFTLGVSLLLACISVYLVDAVNLWNVFTRLLMFATPIFYSIGGQIHLYLFNLLNPIYYYITIARQIMVYHQIPELWMIAGAIGYSIFFLFLGLKVFHKLQKNLAEKV